LPACVSTTVLDDAATGVEVPVVAARMDIDEVAAKPETLFMSWRLLIFMNRTLLKTLFSGEYQPSRNRPSVS
jgi:hypothetical protein